MLVPRIVCLELVQVAIPVYHFVEGLMVKGSNRMVKTLVNIPHLTHMLLEVMDDLICLVQLCSSLIIFARIFVFHSGSNLYNR